MESREAQPQQESAERRPTQRVWDILERKVRLDECYVRLDRYSVPESFRDLREALEYYREQREVKRLEEELSSIRHRLPHDPDG